MWIDGERIKDVTTHPALANGVKSVAALYDMQHDPELREEMTYASPTSGQPVGLSFLIPQSVEDLERRRNMMTRWAWASCGMMGRSPDFLNVIFAAWAGAADYFAQDRPEFKQNVINRETLCHGGAEPVGSLGGSGETQRTAHFRGAAETMGGGAVFRLAGAVPPPLEELREKAQYQSANGGSRLRGANPEEIVNRL